MTERHVDLSKPVIWTSLGNVNEDDVEKFSAFEMEPYAWTCGDQFTRDGKTALGWLRAGGHVIPLFSTVVCVIGARLKETGEIVKRGVYVQTEPQSSTGETAKFN